MLHRKTPRGPPRTAPAPCRRCEDLIVNAPPTTPFAIDTPADLLRRYAPGASVFASPRQTLLASGKRTHLPAGDAATLAQRGAALLAARGGVLMGTVPFDHGTPPRLFVPECVAIAQGGHGGPAPAAQPRGASDPCGLALAPTPDGYRAAVEVALARIARRELAKVVLSRSLTVAARVDLAGLLQRLAQRNPHGYTFAIDLAMGDTARTLIGASPELLLAKSGDSVISHPLAGSIPHVADPVEDARRADNLLRSSKDLYEHQVVVDAVADTLAPLCRQLVVPPAPSLVRTPTMWHLGTEIRGVLIDPAASSLAIALALHPTPAVCGHPTEVARDFIAEVEGFDRGYFTGLTGWMDAHGDGEWAVTIRCAEVGADSATLYAGAGIVAGSDPELELIETSGKLRTMLAAMELDGALEGWA